MLRPSHLAYLVTVMALATAAMILSSCSNPVSSPSSTPATISGKVYDQSTGAALSGATVAIGSTSTTTNSSGNYSLTVPSNGSSVTGNLAVSDGTSASSDGFIYVAGATIPVSNGSATLDVPLPTNYSADTAYVLNVSVDNSSGPVTGGNFTATIINQAGGEQSITGSPGTSFSGLVIPCSSCTVVGSYVPSSGSPWGFYMTNVSITPTGSSGSLSANFVITQPSSASTMVTVTNASTASGASVGAALEMPGVGAVPIATETPSAGSATLAIYNPNSYQVVFGQSVPGPAAAAYSFAAAFSSAGAVPSGNTVSLPSLTVSIPTSSPDMTSASYSNGTLTFTPSTDAAGTMLYMYGAGPAGLVWTTGASVTLPTSIQNLIAAFSSWQTKAFGVNASGVSGVAELDSISEGLLSNAAPVPGAQLADYSVSPQYKSTTVP